ncbi:MAG: hypothetical protein K0R94_522 [Burkholderiales bacterium]|nr:hypothetical protein [Burkholderiales bacterium]
MNFFNHLKQNRFQYCILLMIFFFIILRQWERVHHYVLYAEDGRGFLPRSVMYGFNAVLRPYTGYLQVAPQLISLISYYISLKYYPLITLFICGFIYSLAISSIINSSYSWICRNQMVRFFIALSLTFIPGTTEILGNLANLHTILYIFVTFKMVAKFDAKYSVLDYILFIITAFSAGEFFLILPVVLYRMFVLYKSKQSLVCIFQHLLILLIIVFSIVINYFTALQAGVMGHKNLIDHILLLIQYLPHILLTISNRIFYLPILGNLTLSINHYFIIAVITGVIMILYLRISCIKTIIL